MDTTFIYHYILKYVLSILLLSGLIYACIPFRTKKITVPVINNTSIPTSELLIENTVTMDAGKKVHPGRLFKYPATITSRFHEFKDGKTKISSITNSFTTIPISLWAFPWNKPKTKGSISISKEGKWMTSISYDKNGYFIDNFKLKDGIILQEYSFKIDFTKIPISEIIKESKIDVDISIYFYCSIENIPFNQTLHSNKWLINSMQESNTFVMYHIWPKMYENKLYDIRSPKFHMSSFKEENSYGVDVSMLDAGLPYSGKLLLTYDKNTKSLVFDESVEGYKELRQLNNYFLTRRAASLIRDLKYELVKELWEKYNFDPDPKELDWLCICF